MAPGWYAFQEVWCLVLLERFTFKGQKMNCFFQNQPSSVQSNLLNFLNALFLVMVSFDGFMNYIVELIDNMSSKTADHLRANPLVIAHCIGAMKIITAISIAKDSHVSMISRALFAPHKGIQDSLGFWIPHRGFWILDSGFFVRRTWILDSNR